MKSKLHILALTAVALMLLASCNVHRDRERIETAEALLYSNHDAAELASVRLSCATHGDAHNSR